MKTFIIYLYLGTLSFFYSHSVLFRHPEVIDFYTRLKENAASNIDPFDFYNRYQRKFVCDLLLNANTYYLNNVTYPNIPILGTNITYRNYQNIAHIHGAPEELLKNQQKLVQLNEEQVRLKMFPCTVIPGGAYYVTYGFKPGYIFVVFKRVCHSPILRIVDVLEADPTFDESFVYPRSNMNNYFWGQIETDNEVIMMTDMPPESNHTAFTLFYDVQYPEPTTVHSLAVLIKMELQSISEFQHFRLCIAIADKLRDYPIYDLNIQRKTYVNPMSAIRTVRKGIIKDDGSLIVYAHLLPCAIQREWTSPQFYLLRDPNSPASVFIFRPIENAIHGELMKLEAKMDHVTVLYDL